MPDNLISYAAGNAPDFDMVTIAKAAADAGWPACGIWFDPAVWTAATTREVRAIFRDSGMVPLDIEVIYMAPGPTSPDHRRMLEVGGEIGARNALIVSQDPDMAANADRFAALAAFALAHGVQPNLEFLPVLAIKTLPQALDIIAPVAGAGVLVDLLHLVRSGGSVADLASVPAARLHYAQLCDGLAVLGDNSPAAVLADALDGRSIPGEGALPAEAFVRALPTGLPLSLEIRSKALRDGWPDPLARARHVLAGTRAFMEQLK